MVAVNRSDFLSFPYLKDKLEVGQSYLARVNTPTDGIQYFEVVYTIDSQLVNQEKEDLLAYYDETEIYLIQLN